MSKDVVYPNYVISFIIFLGIFVINLNLHSENLKDTRWARMLQNTQPGHIQSSVVLSSSASCFIRVELQLTESYPSMYIMEAGM